MAMAWQSEDVIEQWLKNDWWRKSRQQNDHQKKTMFDIRTLGLAVYGIQNNVDETILHLRELLRSVQAEAHTEILHTKVEQLAAMVDMRIYTKEELSKRKYRGVSHIVAPVFGPKKQPRYLISLHVMDENVSPDELTHYIKELLVSTEVISNQIGGRPPTDSSAQC